MDLRKGKEQAGVVGPDFIYEALQYYTSHYHEHDTEKYTGFPGVYTRKKSRKLGSGSRLHSLTSMSGNPTYFIS